MQKQRKENLTESQVKLKKLITPIVEGIISEATSPITKKFIPFSQELPPDLEPIFLIDTKGTLYVGLYSKRSGRMDRVQGLFNKEYKDVPVTNFTHWAI